MEITDRFPVKPLSRIDVYQYPQNTLPCKVDYLFVLLLLSLCDVVFGKFIRFILMDSS